MANNAAFSRPAFGGAGSSSWADDDDLDAAPIPLAIPLPKVVEKEVAHEEEPRREESDRRDRRHSGEYREHDQGRRDRGGYEERGFRGERGQGRSDRGGYDDRRAPRGGYEADRAPRGGYDADRPKNPVPDQPPFKLYVGNLPFRVDEHDLADFLGAPETIVDMRFPRDFETDRPKGFAYVEFHDRDALVRALELDGKDLGGRPVKMDVAVEKDRKPRQENNFFEKRSDRPRYERRGQDGPESRTETPRERPRLTLLPRSTSTENKTSSTTKQSIFGDAKPRDEAAVAERKKAEAAKRKAEAAERKNAEAAKKAEAPVKKIERATSAGSRNRKNSHEEGTEPGARIGGRGRGGNERGRGERAGGRGRGSVQPERTPAKKDDAKPKRAEVLPPKATVIAPPPTTKTKNVFDLLGGDDSDSD